MWHILFEAKWLGVVWNTHSVDQKLTCWVKKTKTATAGHKPFSQNISTTNIQKWPLSQTPNTDFSLSYCIAIELVHEKNALMLSADLLINQLGLHLPIPLVPNFPGREKRAGDKEFLSQLKPSETSLSHQISPQCFCLSPLFSVI